jgi:hypothetical protein
MVTIAITQNQGLALDRRIETFRGSERFTSGAKDGEEVFPNCRTLLQKLFRASLL